MCVCVCVCKKVLRTKKEKKLIKHAFRIYIQDIAHVFEKLRRIHPEYAIFIFLYFYIHRCWHFYQHQSSTLRPNKGRTPLLLTTFFPLHRFLSPPPTCHPFSSLPPSPGLLTSDRSRSITIWPDAIWRHSHILSKMADHISQRRTQPTL